MRKLLTALALSAVAVPAWAAVRTVTLSVPGMTCVACPITVREALSKVNGVIHVRVEYAKREAIVTFDDAKSRVVALTRATKDAGYPATVKN